MTGSNLHSDRVCVRKSFEKNSDKIPNVMARMDVFTDYLRRHQADFGKLSYIGNTVCNVIEKAVQELAHFLKNTAWKCPSTNFVHPDRVGVKTENNLKNMKKSFFILNILN